MQGRLNLVAALDVRKIFPCCYLQDVLIERAACAVCTISCMNVVRRGMNHVHLPPIDSSGYYLQFYAQDCRAQIKWSPC